MEEKEKDLQPVPHITFESAQMRSSIREKRLHAMITLRDILLAVLLVLSCLLLYLVHREDMRKLEESNAKWLEYIAQYDFVDYEYSQDGRGVNIIGDGNGVDYHGTTSESKETNPEES